MLRYTIERLNAASDGVPISASEFTEIKDALKGVLFATSVEETLHALLENYVALEVALLEVNVRDIVYSVTSAFEYHTYTLTINRHFGNFLSTATSYLDSVPHELSGNLPNGKKAKDAFRAACAAEASKGLAFPALQLIRNHHQHEGQSVQHLSFQIRRDEAGAEVFAAHFVVPNVSIEELARNPRNTAPVLKQLKDQGSFVDMMPLVREYVAAIGRIQLAVRDQVEPHEGQWVGRLKSVLDRGKARFAGSQSFVVVSRSEQDPSKRIEEVGVSESVLLRLVQLRRQTLRVPHLAKHYASGRPRRK